MEHEDLVLGVVVLNAHIREWVIYEYEYRHEQWTRDGHKHFDMCCLRNAHTIQILTWSLDTTHALTRVFSKM